MADNDVDARPVDDFLVDLFDQVGIGVAELDSERRWLRANRHLHEMLGYGAERLPPTLDDLTHPEDRDVDAINVELLTAGAVDAYRQERRLRRFDDSFLWVDSSMRAIRGKDGSVARLTAVVCDISRYKDAEQRQRTLLAELAHRGRNLFAVLQSLARRSLTAGKTMQEAQLAFQGRLRALSESLTSLMDKDFGGTRLDGLLHRELHSLGARATLDGPALMMTANAAQTFALILHELGTNATKYGALSTSTGTVSVRWTVSGSGDAARFSFAWSESNGPPVRPPSRRGFGTTLITDVAGAEFDCEPWTSYEAPGFAYRFDAPLARVGTPVNESALRRKLRSPMLCALYDGWVRERTLAGTLSSFAGFDWSRFAATGVMTVAKVGTDGSTQITRVGRALVERLGRPLSEEELAGQELHGMHAAYARCARRAAPCHEYLRFDLGGADPVALERLLVPFAETPGGPVSYVVGIAVFTGSAADPARAAKHSPQHTPLEAL
jgi:PAS domain S-box-containing protein